MPREHGRDSRDIPKETIEERMHDKTQWVDCGRCVKNMCVYVSTCNTIKLMPNPNKVSMCTVIGETCVIEVWGNTESIRSKGHYGPNRPCEQLESWDCERKNGIDRFSQIIIITSDEILKIQQQIKMIINWEKTRHKVQNQNGILNNN